MAAHWCNGFLKKNKACISPAQRGTAAFIYNLRNNIMRKIHAHGLDDAKENGNYRVLDALLISAAIDGSQSNEPDIGPSYKTVNNFSVGNPQPISLPTRAPFLRPT